MTLGEEISGLFREYRSTRNPAILAQAEAKQVYVELGRRRPQWQLVGNTTYFMGRGTTRSALLALAVVLRHAKGLTARVIKHQEAPHSHLSFAGICLTNGDHNFVIPDGFAEGYSGEGPRGLKTAMEMLKMKNVPTVDLWVSKNQFEDIFSDCNRREE